MLSPLPSSTLMVKELFRLNNKPLFSMIILAHLCGSYVSVCISCTPTMRVFSDWSLFCLSFNLDFNKCFLFLISILVILLYRICLLLPSLFVCSILKSVIFWFFIFSAFKCFIFRRTACWQSKIMDASSISFGTRQQLSCAHETGSVK